MTEATLTPAAALAERVRGRAHAGHLDLAPARRASALTALEPSAIPPRGMSGGYTCRPHPAIGRRPPAASASALLCCPSWMPTDWSSWTVNLLAEIRSTRAESSSVPCRRPWSTVRIASALWSPITFPARNGLPRFRLPLPRTAPPCWFQTEPPSTSPSSSTTTSVPDPRRPAPASDGIGQRISR